MQLFYNEHIPEEGTFGLDETESKHLVRALRKKAGDQVFFTNGKGVLFTCSLLDDHPKKCVLDIQSKQQHQPDFRRELHLAIAPTKNNDRLEWCVEKITEIGIGRITPIICDNSERTKLKIDRIKRIAISAMKQSNQFFLPEIDSPISFSNFIQNYPATSDTSSLIAHCEPLHKKLLQQFELQDKVVLLIGPEGDFTSTEIETALEAGYQAVSLGETRLRTETAGIVGITLLQHQQ